MLLSFDGVVIYVDDMMFLFPGRVSLRQLALCLINSATLISGPNHLDIPQKTLRLKALMTTGSCQRKTKSYCQGITSHCISACIVNLHNKCNFLSFYITNHIICGGKILHLICTSIKFLDEARDLRPISWYIF